MATPVDDDPMRWLRDRAAITDLVLRFALALDTHDWALLRACLADVVEVDYRGFRGEPPGRLSAEAFVERRRTALSALRMQHISTNHLVEVDGDAGRCHSCFLIHRLHPALPEGANTLDSAGHYLHRLRRTADGWVMTGITQRLLWSRGHPEVHGALRPPPATPSPP